MTSLLPLLLLLLLTPPRPTVSLTLPYPPNAYNPSNTTCCAYGTTPLPVRTARKLPTIIGLGIHKASTSFLFNLMKVHPDIVGPENSVKELYMFADWPLQHLSFKQYLDKWPQVEGGDAGVGELFEYTATYLHTAGAACRMKSLLPNAKFIVVLRDPISRAISHHNMHLDMYRSGELAQQPPDFLETVSHELSKLKDLGCTFTDYKTQSWNDCFRCSYITTNFEEKHELCSALNLTGGGPMVTGGPIQRGVSKKQRGMQDILENPCRPKIASWMLVSYGIYSAPIAWWLHFFPKEQFIFLNSEEVNSKSVEVANRVMKFVGLDEIFTEELVNQNTDNGVIDTNSYKTDLSVDDPELQDIIQEMREYYAPQIKGLYDLFDELGVDFPEFEDWPRGGDWEKMAT